MDPETIRCRLGAAPATERVAGVQRMAAVATILRWRGEPEVLLIRRAEREGDPWSGHMAFPGGRREPGDRDLLATACRETHEEVGIRLDSEGSLLGRLDDLEAYKRGLIVRPFVFALPDGAPTTPNEEVAEVLWTPLAPLMRGELQGELGVEHEGRRVRFPAHHLGGRAVWGLTYRMLELLFARLR